MMPRRRSAASARAKSTLARVARAAPRGARQRRRRGGGGGHAALLDLVDAIAVFVPFGEHGEVELRCGVAVGRFVRSFVRSFVCLFVRSFVRPFVERRGRGVRSRDAAAAVVAVARDAERRWWHEAQEFPDDERDPYRRRRDSPRRRVCDSAVRGWACRVVVARSAFRAAAEHTYDGTTISTRGRAVVALDVSSSSSSFFFFFFCFFLFAFCCDVAYDGGVISYV